MRGEWMFSTELGSNEFVYRAFKSENSQTDNIEVYTGEPKRKNLKEKNEELILDREGVLEILTEAQGFMEGIFIHEEKPYQESFEWQIP